MNNYIYDDDFENTLENAYDETENYEDSIDDDNVVDDENFITTEESSENLKNDLKDSNSQKYGDTPTYDDKDKKTSDVLVEPLNWTDPIIYHDPIEEIKKSVVAKKYIPEKGEAPGIDGVPLTFNAEDSLKTEGIFQPIIKLNNIVLDYIKIEYMIIYYKNIVPTLDLCVRDISSIIKFKDIPGQNNIITVILTAPKDGIYKKISLDFVITSYDDIGDNLLLYTATYKLLSLEQSKFEGIIYDKCNNNECNQQKVNLPNTWETFHEIAKRTGLGFASTDKCKDINDRLPRLLQNISYIDYIENIIKYAGIDTDSIFDCWIDLYGYLVLINVAWVLNEDIKYNNLSIVTLKGRKHMNVDRPDQTVQETIRTITNNKDIGIVSNLEIESYKILSNPGALFNEKSLTTYNIFHPEGVNGAINNISTEQIQIVEDSIDGKHIEDYETSKTEDLYFEFNDYDVHQQEKRRDAFFLKNRANMMEVVMKDMNFGLQRGTLINVNIYEYEFTKKQTIIQQMSNLVKENNSDEVDISLKDPELRSLIYDWKTQFGIINPALSGLYYIDSMEISYSKENRQFKQTLYLINKSKIIQNYDNKYTFPKVEI